MLLSPGYFRHISLIKEQRNKKHQIIIADKISPIKIKQKSRGLLVYSKNTVFSPKIEIQKTQQKN